MYNAYITEVKELRKHSNADRLQVATFFGNDTIVGLDVKVGDITLLYTHQLFLTTNNAFLFTHLYEFGNFYELRS